MSSPTPPPPLPENGKLDTIGVEAHQVELENEKQTVESNEPSTVASSTVDGVENAEFPENNNPANKGKAVDEPVEYPKGVEVFFIMLALVLSITLCSLDQVSSTAPISSQSRLLPMRHTPGS